MSRKTKVLSIRIPLEDLQSCFDLCSSAKHPTTIASSAIVRSLSLLLQNLRSADVLPSYTSGELSSLCAFYTEKINPSSMPSLELSSISQVSKPLFALPIQRDAESEASMFCALDPSSEASISSCTSSISDKETFERTQTDSEVLEDEILKQMKEIELEDEVDLLSKILIS